MAKKIKRTISSAPAASQDMATQSCAAKLVAAMNHWWVAYSAWRIERAAIAQLWSMSDRELKDIGLARSAITGAVRGEATRNRVQLLMTEQPTPEPRCH